MYKVGRSRTPQGVRGLKQEVFDVMKNSLMSHSARSAWIETASALGSRIPARVALRKECVD